MKYIDEYRDKKQAEALAEAIRKTATRPWHIMEICGGQTHAIARYRLEEMLPPEVKLLHGPGCPVCVTPEYIIDYALELAMQPNVILASFGDMMRVPGSRDDLLRVKAKGGDVRMLYSPLDAVEIARENPTKEVIFFAVGFETTAPAHLQAVKEAERRGLTNIRLLTSLFTVPPAIAAILSAPDTQVDGFLLAGHVCSITGYEGYHPLASEFKTPMVVTGFEPVDLLYGIYRCICQLETGTHTVENAYTRIVTERGNLKARALMDEMLEPCDQEWRGIGIIEASGLRLKDPGNFAVPQPSLFHSSAVSPHAPTCMAGEIMRGIKQVVDCPHFGTTCTPETPVGAPMVSTEGVCSAYYTYK